jgi:hypothetical protein
MLRRLKHSKFEVVAPKEEEKKIVSLPSTTFPVYSPSISRILMKAVPCCAAYMCLIILVPLNNKTSGPG